VQIDGDDVLTLPISVALAPGVVRLLQPLPHLLHDPLDDFRRGMAVGR
jgi:hypothetical protein